MSFLGLDLRRTYLIARRDYLGYVKTWGFWISFFLPVIFTSLAIFASTLDINVQPTRYETILDETGKHGAAMQALSESRDNKLARNVTLSFGKKILSKTKNKELERIFDTQGVEAARDFLDQQAPGVGKRLKIPDNKVIYLDPPATTIDELKPYLRGEKLVRYNGEEVRLNGVLHIFGDVPIYVQVWSENINNSNLRNLARDYFGSKATEAYLGSGGLTTEGLKAAQKGSIDISTFDPTKEQIGSDDTQEVTERDKVPYYVAAGLAAFLWFTVFSASYMLLTSMLEEKLNKLLEMMLASTKFAEIMCGKLVGVAVLTVTAMLPYIIFGSLAIILLIKFGDPEIASGLRDAFNAKMIIFFIIFLILGYIFYGALFIAMGAMANSMQDAQTLTTPIMLLLSACVLVVPLGMGSPDSPVLVWASWFPLSAPFASIIRIPTDPPLWEIVLSAVLLFVSSVFVIWVAGRMFRYGVLSGSGVSGVKSWFMRTVLRRKA